MDGEYRLAFPGRVTFGFRRDDDEVLYCPSPATSAEEVEDLFLSTALPLKLHVEGAEALHASAVTFPSGVVAFCGMTKAGKSTVAFALARRGYRMWSDDVLVLTPPGDQEGRVMCLSLPWLARLRPETERYLGGTPDAGRVAAGSVTAPLIACAALDRGGAASACLERLELSERLSLVLPHAFCFFPEEGRAERSAAAYLDALARVPVYRFSFPDGFEALETALDELEQNLVAELNASAAGPR